jgi:hypothetical protein
MASAALSTLWSSAHLPLTSLSCIRFTGHPETLPSSFRVGTLAQASLGAAALAAAQLLGHRTEEDVGRVSVSADDAAAEFRSEQLGSLNGEVRFCEPFPSSSSN